MCATNSVQQMPAMKDTQAIPIFDILSSSRFSNIDILNPVRVDLIPVLTCGELPLRRSHIAKLRPVTRFKNIVVDNSSVNYHIGLTPIVVTNRFVADTRGEHAIWRNDPLSRQSAFCKFWRAALVDRFRCPIDNEIYSWRMPRVLESNGSPWTSLAWLYRHYRDPGSLFQMGIMASQPYGVTSSPRSRFHLTQLSLGGASIDSGSDEGESRSDSRHPLRYKVTGSVGIVLAFLCWFFLYFRFDPYKWWWQFPLCVLLLIISFILIADGVYGLA
jgi:hypothetical protein